ncbi:MAG: hypothetical protein GX654_05940 [Desulfatiglans sp.]|nr:hypothetical protein [Desulfatiglans sp.]
MACRRAGFIIQLITSRPFTGNGLKGLGHHIVNKFTLGHLPDRLADAPTCRVFRGYEIPGAYPDRGRPGNLALLQGCPGLLLFLPVRPYRKERQTI